MKRASLIVVPVLAWVLSSWPAAAAQETEPRFSLLSEVDSPAVSAGPTLDPSTTLLLDPPTLGIARRKAAPAGAPADRPPGGLTYQLGDAWTAGVSYRHALLFGTSKGEVLRQQPFSDFATDRDRDVLKLNMSWDLTLTRLDVGYRLESARAEPGQDRSGRYSLLGVLPESDHTLHSLTLGVTRRWGGAK